MTTAIKRRRGTTAEHSTFVGLEGEITIDSTKDTVVVHDGSTAGGFPLAKESGSSISAVNLTASGTVTIPDNAISGDKVEGGTINAITINTLSANPTLFAGTANGVTYLNGSKVLTSGSALTFDGTNLGIGTTSPLSRVDVRAAPGELGRFAVTSGAGFLLIGGNASTTEGLRLTYDSGDGSSNINNFYNAALKFSTNNTERVRITNAGLVGIGTSSPFVQLELSSVDPILRFNDSNGGTDTKNFELRYVGTSSPDIDGLYFRSVNDANSVYTDRMAILGNGNVGIGTISPEAKLHIGGNTASTQQAIFTTGVTDPAFKVVARNGVSGATAVQGYIGLDYSNGTWPLLAGMQFIRNSTSGELAFTAGATTSASEQMRLNSTGLGIGTSSPTDRLTVSGGGIVVNSGNVKVTDGSTTFQMGVNNFTTGYGMGTTSNSPLIFAANGAERVRITSAGNVGIGTTSPENKLTIVKNTTAATENSYGIAVQSVSTNGYTELLLGASDAVDAGIIQTAAKNTNFTAKNLALQPQGGNVGIGTSSPASKLHLSSSASTAQTITSVGTNVYSSISFANTTTGYGYDIGFGGSASIAPNSFYVYGGSSASVKMVIDSSGNVGVGTSTLPVWNGNVGRKFVVTGPSSNTNAIISLQSGATGINTGGAYEAYSTNTTSGSVALGSIAFLRENTSTTALSSYTGFYTNNAGSVTEKARIDSSGDLLVGKTTPGAVLVKGIELSSTGAVFSCMDSASQSCYVTNIAASGTRFLYRFYAASTLVGTITSNGSSTAYNTSSDYRLKEDWQVMTGASERVNALKPVNFAWKADGSRVDGFLAHEAAEVVPEAVTGEKDAVDAEGKPVYQGIDQSKLVPLLTAALQEALAEINALKARLDAANI
jgi:hypothetical protein